MASKYLARDDAPFDPEVWTALDDAMAETARSRLVGRRMLDVKGPYGLGLKTVPLPDERGDGAMVAGRAMPVIFLHEGFTMGTRDLAAFERDGIALDTCAVAEAARAIARAEDALVFHGSEGAGGLLTSEGAASADLSSWDEVGQAAEDIIRAITKLDDAGFPGPYALALAPVRYNRMLRLVPQAKRTELDHLRTMAADGVFKAPALDDGGVLVASTAHCASIVLGQDMHVGYVGPAGFEQELTVSESLCVLVREPRAICALRA